MLLINPPVVKPCEPPAGIARLAGALQAAGRSCRLVDCAIEGVLYLLRGEFSPEDTWSRRAVRHLEDNLQRLQDPTLYTHPARYQRAVADVNRALALAGRAHGLSLQLANYQDPQLSPLHSQDLLSAAAHYEDNIFYPYFSRRLSGLLETANPTVIGFSLNYLSQALPTFAMMGYVKEQYPSLTLVLGGGLVTSWMRNPGWRAPFAGLVDHCVAGPGEQPLLELLGLSSPVKNDCPDYQHLARQPYMAPGFILPYAASSGCYWSKCSFCPETAEGNPYQVLSSRQVLRDVQQLRNRHTPVLLHLLDNAVSPQLMTALARQSSGLAWYGFARASELLTDLDFCISLRASGCVMLKLGLESGDQQVLDAMDKGIHLDLVSRVLTTLEAAGIATYVYLLFGTPAETDAGAEKTLDFIVRHHSAVTFLNLAIFNLPVCSAEVKGLQVCPDDGSDLSLYRQFVHPRGWSRGRVRRFLDKEFKRHPAIAPILQRDPYLFSSNHASFLIQGRS